MARYEYKLVPAPAVSKKFKGLSKPERFAATLEEVMNTLGADGWEYLRSDTLPVEERSGLASKQTIQRSVLIFHRPVAEPASKPLETQEKPAKPKPARRPPPAPKVEAPKAPEPRPEPSPEPHQEPEPDLMNLLQPARRREREDDTLFAAARALRHDDPKP